MQFGARSAGRPRPANGADVDDFGIENALCELHTYGGRAMF
jgi:hypothetical protein